MSEIEDASTVGAPEPATEAESAESTVAEPVSAEPVAAEPQGAEPALAEPQAAEPVVANVEAAGATAEVPEAPEAEAAEPVPPEEITYHAVERDGQVAAIWEMQGRKHMRTIDPRSRQGQEILRLYTSDHHEEAPPPETGEAAAT